MRKPINILDKKQQLELPVGSYSLKVLGGWKVITNNFSIIFRDVNGETLIKPKETFWKVQSFAFGKRAKKIATVDIPKRGIYEIEFLNPSDLKVKKSNLIILGFFQNFIPSNEIQVCIE
jgi:hypothetical protein